VGDHATSTDLGDLDGDGDPELVVSSFFGRFWRGYRNDGTGTFAPLQEFAAPQNPSCAVLYDSDEDGDLDMALTDEIADVIVLLRNLGSPIGVDPVDPAAGIGLLANAPNPFWEETRIRFLLARSGPVRIEVFDLAGRRVMWTDPVRREAGWQSVRFEGRDHFGHPLRPGVYTYRVVGDGVVGRGKFVVTR
jgi:hypothetical protein